MEPSRTRFPRPMQVSVELTARVIDLEAVDSAPCCPDCDQALNLHQPDERLPDQLLATCDSCFRWYSLFELSDNASEVLMLELPGRSTVTVEEVFLRNGTDRRE